VVKVRPPHLPMRPVGLCQNCAASWPCPPAQLDLVTEFYGHSVALAFYLAMALQDAIADAYTLGHAPDLTALHGRYLGWLSMTRRPRDFERR
jgi:hypothetical protein